MDVTLLIDLADIRDYIYILSNFTGIREMMKLSFLGISEILGFGTSFYMVILLGTFSNQAG